MCARVCYTIISFRKLTSIARYSRIGNLTLVSSYTLHLSIISPERLTRIFINIHTHVYTRCMYVHDLSTYGVRTSEGTYTHWPR